MPKRRRDSPPGLSPLKKRLLPPHVRALHDKTIYLLYEGANRKNNNYHNDPPKHETPTYGIIKETKNMRQMCINKDGSLSSSDCITISDVTRCISCKSCLYDNNMNCNYCDLKQCSSCAKVCCACNTPTCNNCSINSYCNSDGVWCLNCCK